MTADMAICMCLNFYKVYICSQIIIINSAPA